MSNEKMREDYESYIILHTDWETVRNQYDEGWDYLDCDTEQGWRIWQASRAALCVELPAVSMSEYANRHSFNCASEAIQFCKSAIESTGVSTK